MATAWPPSFPSRFLIDPVIEPKLRSIIDSFWHITYIIEFAHFGVN